MDYSILNVSPIDGRYSSKTQSLPKYFSEYAYIYYRLKVEIEYLDCFLDKLDKNNTLIKKKLKDIINKFSLEEAEKIKEIERNINHDVKSIEYYIRRKLNEYGLGEKLNHYIHYGLTSQDINSTALSVMLKEFTLDHMIPTIITIVNLLKDKRYEYQYINMIGLTHGQPATMMTMGRFFELYYHKLSNQLSKLKEFEYSTKFGGAVGTFEAHKHSLPEINWDLFAEMFLIYKFGLKRQTVTNQIMNYEHFSELFSIIQRINSILIDFSVNIWLYVSRDYFCYDNGGDVGSSAMPHKINPILFENAEGNLIMANGIFDIFNRKLPISRWQRDLTDSTIVRNFGTPYGHCIIAYKNLISGIKKIAPNREVIDAELKKNVLVSSEIIQTILRSYGVKDAYETIKKLTQKHDKISYQEIIEFVEKQDWVEDCKDKIYDYLKRFQ